MKYLIAILFLSISVFMLIVAKIYDIGNNDWRIERKIGKQWKNDDEPKNLFWFLQISDIHLSKFRDNPNRVEDFRKFCTEVVNAVKPKIVIASGDLTDAKDQLLGSRQYQEEWEAYFSTLVETNVLNKTIWLDQRGNHDNFDVEALGADTDFYRKFSAQGKNHLKSYLHQENVDGVKYNFVGLDASIEPGSKRPYNFIGMVPQEEVDKVEKLLNDKPGNFTIWFTHYPTSTIMTSSHYGHIRKFIGKYDTSVAILNGHLHTLGGMAHRMYTLQSEGFLELELGDFMKNRRFRLAVLDHGLLSFADVKLNTWPIAVITNPKDMLFNNPFREDISLQKTSSHIRVVAFSPAEITQCKIRIDDGEWEKCTKKTENFFVVPWSSVKYITGKHKIELFIGDRDGRIFIKEQFFALDGTRLSFDFMAQFILMSDVTTIFQILFVIAFSLCLFPLMFFKIWLILIKREIVKRPRIESKYWRSFVQKYMILVSVNRIFYGLIFLLLYTTLGPWSFHEIVNGHIGYIFLWGTFVKGQFVPGTLSYWYGFHQLLFFQLPLIIIIAGVLKRRFNTSTSGGVCDNKWGSILKSNIPFLALVIAETLLAILNLQQNGFIPFLIAPLRTWGLIFSIFLFYQAQFKIPEHIFLQSMLVWSITETKIATS